MSKDYCPNCYQNTNHRSLFKENISSKDFEDFRWTKDYEVIKCEGCENIQYKTTYSDESMTAYDPHTDDEVDFSDHNYYPRNLKGHKVLKNIYYIPDKIRIVYIETIEAMKNNCYLLSAVGLRAIIEAICLEQNIMGRNLELKINNLSRNKLITEKDSNRLHSIRFLGNDSVHEMEVPKEDKLNIALKIVESLIDNLYLIDIDANMHLDTIITDYEKFRNLFLRRFIPMAQNEEKSIKELLGKDYRRIETSYVANFTQQIIDEINNNIIGNISVGNIKNSTVENSPVQHFFKN